MHQGTTIINAEKLFGNLSDPGEFKDYRDGFEKYWEWPEGIGNGFMHIIKLRPGLILGIGNHRLTEDIAISFKFKYSPVVLGFSISGDVSHTVNYGEGQKNFWHFKHGHSVIAYLPECQGVAKYPAGISVRGVCLYIDPLLLRAYFSRRLSATQKASWRGTNHVYMAY